MDPSKAFSSLKYCFMTPAPKLRTNSSIVQQLYPKCFDLWTDLFCVFIMILFKGQWHVIIPPKMEIIKGFVTTLIEKQTDESPDLPLPHTLSSPILAHIADFLKTAGSVRPTFVMVLPYMTPLNDKGVGFTQRSTFLDDKRPRCYYPATMCSKSLTMNQENIVKLSEDIVQLWKQKGTLIPPSRHFLPIFGVKKKDKEGESTDDPLASPESYPYYSDDDDDQSP